MENKKLINIKPSHSVRWMNCNGSAHLPFRSVSKRVGNELLEEAEQLLTRVKLTTKNEAVKFYIDGINEVREDVGVKNFVKEGVEESVFYKTQFPSGREVDGHARPNYFAFYKDPDGKKGEHVLTIGEFNTNVMPPSIVYNWKLKLYAKALISSFGFNVSTIIFNMYHPLALNGDKHSHYSLTMEGFNEEFKSIEKRYGEIENEPEKYNVGSWCKYCPCALSCPKLNEAMNNAEAIGKERGMEVAVDLLNSRELLEGAVNLARDVVEGRITNGLSVDGWKLVEKVTRRKWKNADIVVKKLEEMGLVELIVKSPVKFSDFAKSKSGDAKKVLAEFSEKPVGGLEVARESDRRQSVHPAASYRDSFEVGKKSLKSL